MRLLLVLLVWPALALAQTPPPAGTIEYYHVDALGSVRAVTDTSGAVVRTHHYHPFGEAVGVEGSTDPLRFTGKPRDAETGLDYFGARYYAGRTGRFTTVDPVINLGAALLDPQRWHRYGYSRNNPGKYVDPDGRDLVVAVHPRVIESFQLFRSSLSGWLGDGSIATVVDALVAPVAPVTRAEIGESLMAAAAPTAMVAAPGRRAVGAVIGHVEAGYAKAGRQMGAAVFDIPTEIWGRMSSEQRSDANRAFLDGVIEKGLAVQVITNGFVRIRSALQWEIQYLRSKGYVWNNAGSMLLPPGK